ncbi:MAG: hypothetical protein H7Y22_09810 [Gemmatimonadaceae bacterium]|nr:hypothetical protein [Gloeobacterales cyanobacterium ES-bin-141]
MKAQLGSWLHTVLLASGLVGCGLLMIPTASAATCTPLEPLGSKVTAVKKSISPPGTFVTDNNWNTDFAVPGNARFERFVTTIKPDSDGQYDIRVVLKYSDGSSDIAFEQTGKSLGKGKAFEVSGKPANLEKQPFQINASVGGPVSTGKSYTLSTVGCQ